ncbi:MAG: NAD(P)H-binding protein [Planctomycetota bacterium]|nr:NAD(P)H-binding protein [Planctomycetota bacterium]
MSTVPIPDASPSSPRTKTTVAIAGASGFVGRALRDRLHEEFDLVALTRSQSRSDSTGQTNGVTWRQCDLFDPEAIESALEGVDILVYLVHSMSPQSRLTQAGFEDLDLLLADNVRTACEAAGVERIIYLGGLGSQDEETRLSRHLESRKEVGRVLASGTPRVTQLRAGVVIGRGGSSLRMLTRLIKRLPMMVLPKWTATPTQPVGLEDVVRAFQTVLRHPEEWEGSFDLGIGEEMTYGQMIMRTAAHLGSRPLTVEVPIASPKVSTLWIMLFSGEPRSLVFPLVSSLSSPTVASPNRLLETLAPGMQGFDQALEDAIGEGGCEEDPRREMRRQDRTIINRKSLVRSIQRMSAPVDWTPSRIVSGYWEWLGWWGGPLLKVRTKPTPDQQAVESVDIDLMSCIRMLSLRRDPARCSAGSEVLAITGGLLLRRNATTSGRFEFRRIAGDPKTILVVLQDYAPSLPWYLYEMTQAVIHLVVMRAFRGWLKKRIQPRTGR